MSLTFTRFQRVFIFLSSAGVSLHRRGATRCDSLLRSGRPARVTASLRHAQQYTIRNLSNLCICIYV